MQIVFVSTWPPQQCGIATYTEKLAQALKVFGHRPYVLSERTLLNGGHDTNVLPLWDRHVARESLYGLSAIVKTIETAPRKPDVVHIQHEFGIFPNDQEFCWLVKSLQPFSRVYITLHTVDRNPRLQRLAQNLPLGASCIVHSLEAKLAVPAKSFVIPHGVSKIERPRHNPLTPFLFLCPGFMGANKGQIEIVKAFSLLNSFTGLDSNPCVLALVGLCRDENYLQTLKTEIINTGLPIRLEPYYQSSESLHNWFSSADTVVLGSNKNTPLSASGQAHMAMGYNLPIIAKDVQIYRHLNALYYRTAEECAFWMQRMLNYPQDEQLSNHNYLTWSQVAQLHLQVYEK